MSVGRLVARWIWRRVASGGKVAVKRKLKPGSKAFQKSMASKPKSATKKAATKTKPKAKVAPKKTSTKVTKVKSKKIRQQDRDKAVQSYIGRLKRTQRNKKAHNKIIDALAKDKRLRVGELKKIADKASYHVGDRTRKSIIEGFKLTGQSTRNTARRLMHTKDIF